MYRCGEMLQPSSFLQLYINFGLDFFLMIFVVAGCAFPHKYNINVLMRLNDLGNGKKSSSMPFGSVRLGSFSLCFCNFYWLIACTQRQQQSYCVLKSIDCATCCVRTPRQPRAKTSIWRMKKKFKKKQNKHSSAGIYRIEHKYVPHLCTN